MSFFDKISPYFKYTPSERKGIVFLLFILSVLFVGKLIVSYFNVVENQVDISIDLLEVENEIDGVNFSGSVSKNAEIVKKRNTHLIVDPNVCLKSDLLKIGFNEFVAENIIKFRKSGALYNTINDLQKVYGIDSVFLLENRKQFKFPEKTKIKGQAFFIKDFVDINIADTLELDKLSGIGSVLSRRIIKYRNLLGGFYSKKQLKEVYGIDSSCYSRLEKQIEIVTPLIKVININTAQANEMSSHPYLSYYQAKAIVHYRELIGNFTNIYQLRQNYILNENEYNRVCPYLKLK